MGTKSVPAKAKAESPPTATGGWDGCTEIIKHGKCRPGIGSPTDGEGEWYRRSCLCCAGSMPFVRKIHADGFTLPDSTNCRTWVAASAWGPVLGSV